MNGLRKRVGKCWAIPIAVTLLATSTISMAAGDTRTRQLSQAPGGVSAARIEVVDFSIQPLTPKESDKVTVKLTAKNQGATAQAKVAWKIIHVGSNRVLAQGEEVNLNPGGSFTKTATWTAVAGQQAFRCVVDAPSGSLAAATQNGSKTVTVNVAAAAAPAGAKPATASRAAGNTAVAGKAAADRAKIDPKDMKIDLSSQTGNSQLTQGINNKKDPFSQFQGGNHGGRQGYGGQQGSGGRQQTNRGPQQGGRGNNTNQNGVWINSGKDVKGMGDSIADAVGGKPVVTGQRHGDTFAGGRVNSKHTGGGSRNYRGNVSSGFARDGGTDGSDNKDENGNYTSGMTKEEGGLDQQTLNDMMRSEGVTPSGNADKDAQELSYAMSVGRDMYQATKNMSNEQRREYLNGAANRQKQGQRPREDKDVGGQWKPVTRQDLQRQNKGINSRINQADGAKEQTGGSRMVKTGNGQDDKPQKERVGGQINMDKVLQINTTINPGRQ